MNSKKTNDNFQSNEFIMKKLLSALFILFAGAYGAALAAYGQNTAQDSGQIQKGIVKIHTSSLNGTGFFISPDTLVTNFHIVVDEKGLLPVKTFRLSNGDKFYNEVKIKGVKALSPLDDLAVLETANYKGAALKLSEYKNTSKEVHILGFTSPGFIRSGGPTTIKGVIEKQNDKDYRIKLLGDMPYKAMIMPYLPGMSGGPVLDSRGNVIAVTKSGEFHILAASAGKSLIRLLEEASAVSSTGIELFHEKIEKLKQLAEQGLSQAQHVLGEMYEKGIGLPQNHTLAHQWIKKSAEQGNRYSQFSLGLMYSDNEYSNPEKSHKWIKRSAEQGLSQAQLTLGLMYYTGLQKQKNYKKAYKWVKKATEQGNPQAQLLLGFMYQRGKAIPRDYTEAYEWVKKAKEQGVPLAKHYLKLIPLIENIRNTTKKTKRACLNIFN